MMRFSKLFFFSLGLLVFFCCCTSQQEVSDSKLHHKFEEIDYQFEDAGLNHLLPALEKRTEFTEGQNFNYLTFIEERIRITKFMRKRVDPEFSGEKVQFEIDTTRVKDRFSVLAIIEK